jgi:hypothetical protein
MNQPGLETSNLSSASGAAKVEDKRQCCFHVHRKPSGRTYEHYVCANGRGVHKSLKGLYVREEELLDAFSPALDAITITEEMADDIRTSLLENHQRVLKKQQREAEAYDQSMKELEAREDRLYEDLKAGLLDEEGYKRHVLRVREERKKFAVLLHAAQRTELDAYLPRRYEMKKPFQILSEMASSEKWGDRRGSNPRHLESQSNALPTELRPPQECGH